MHQPRPSTILSIAVLAVGVALAPANGQGSAVVEFPDPAMFYQNTTFVIDGDVGYVPSFDNDTLWSFSVVDGVLLDADGLALPSPGTASDAFIFADGRLAIPGWFPSQAIYVADISDPTDLSEMGIIPFSAATNIQGQNVEIDDDGVVGFVASFPNDTLYSFNVVTMSLEDPDGLTLPGNPDRIARAGDRVAMVDTTNGRIMVADVTNPADLLLAGVIELPGSNSFGSNDNIVFADDGRTGFVSSNERVLYSFDVLTLELLHSGGLVFGAGSVGDHVAIHGDTVACISSSGLSFIDVSDPTAMSLIANADFGGTIAPQGSATVAFTADGTMAAIPVVFPGLLVYTFEVATGVQVADPFLVDAQPNQLTIFGPSDRVGVICSTEATIWLIDGLFPVPLPGDIDQDGDVDLDDFSLLAGCVNGPDVPAPPSSCDQSNFDRADLDHDDDVDFIDFGLFQVVFTGL